MVMSTSARLIRLFRSAELAYAVVTLFALTQGPVYRVWSESNSHLDILPNPSPQHVYFATFVAVQLPAVVLWSRRANIDWFRDRANQVLIALLGWLGLSVVWSTFARHAMPDYVALALTTCFGWYLAASFSRREFWWVVASAMALGVAISWFSIMRLWDGAVNLQEDYWIGIYGNRNSLAPVTAMAIIAAFGVLLSSPRVCTRRFGLESVLTVLFVAALVFFATIELWNSSSQTSPSALAVAFLACLGWLVVRRVMIGLRLPAGVRSLSAPLVLAVSAVVLFFALRTVGGVGGVVTETRAFNQRSGLWTLSWQGFLERPWLGWGWMAAWNDPSFLSSQAGPTWMTWGMQWSHNAYHDLLLGGGAPAALFFVLYLWFASQAMSPSNPVNVVLRMFLAVFVLAAATQESFFIGSHFLWALLVAALAAAVRAPESVDEEHARQPTT
jgi:O-antigen ligase